MKKYSNPFNAVKEKSNKIYYSYAQPETVKADCKDGKFIPLGSKDKKTCPDTLSIQVLKFADIPNAILFPFDEKREAHTWTQVFFVDTKGLLCSTLLKNESRDNFYRAIRDVEIQSEGEKNFTDFAFALTFSERKSKKNVDYYAVTFEATSLSKEDFDRNRDFCNENHEHIYDRRVIVEYVAQNLPQINQSNLNECFADILCGFGLIGEEVHGKLVGNQNAIAAPVQSAENE